MYGEATPVLLWRVRRHGPMRACHVPQPLIHLLHTGPSGLLGGLCGLHAQRHGAQHDLAIGGATSMVLRGNFVCWYRRPQVSIARARSLPRPAAASARNAARCTVVGALASSDLETVETCGRLRKWTDTADLEKLELPPKVAVRFAARRQKLADTRHSPEELDARRDARLLFLEDAARLHTVVRLVMSLLCLSGTACPPPAEAQSATPLARCAAEAVRTRIRLSHATPKTVRGNPLPPPLPPPPFHSPSSNTWRAHGPRLVQRWLLVARRNNEGSCSSARAKHFQTR